MPTPDVYLLTAFDPYTDQRHPVPINALIVHALTLLHPAVPQPDGGMIYRCLTEFPGRHPHEIVPVSTLTFEFDGGRLWSQIGDWVAVTDALVGIARAGDCDAMPLGLPEIPAFLLAMGPLTDNVLHPPRWDDGAPGPGASPGGTRQARHPPAQVPRRGPVLAWGQPRSEAEQSRRNALSAASVGVAVNPEQGHSGAAAPSAGPHSGGGGRTAHRRRRARGRG